MLKSFHLLVLVSLCEVSSCQSTHPVATTGTTTNQAVPTTSPVGASTEAEARASLARYIQQLPNAAVYQLESATATDVDTKWQIMVPRTDWAKVMPNAAAFEVDKRTATVTVLRVK